MKDKPISGSLKIFLVIVLNALANRIDQIHAAALKPLVTSLIGSLRKIVEALSDSDPDNEEQLKKIARESAQETVTSYNNYLKEEHVPKIETQEVRELVIQALDRSRDISIILTDDDPNNSEQLKQLLEKYDVQSAEAIRDLLVYKMRQSGNPKWNLAIEIFESVDLSDLLDPLE